MTGNSHCDTKNYSSTLFLLPKKKYTASFPSPLSDDDLCFTTLFRKTEIYMIPVDKIQIYRIIKKT